LHYPAAAAALARGVSVLVEKPATCTIDELRKLRDLESRHGAFLQIGQQQRFGQQENWLKNWLRSPAFGEPRLFNLDLYQNIEGYISDKPDAWILDKNKAGGGIAISVGIHVLDLLRYWFEDDFVEVYAQGRFDPPLINGAESTVAATLKMRNGTVGTLNCSYTAKRCPYSQRCLVFGTSGTLYQHMDIPGGGYNGEFHIASDGGQPSPLWEMMYQGWERVSARIASEQGARPASDPFVEQMLHFARSVREGRPGENSLERNFNTLAVVEALGRSLLSGRPESVEEA
jgi:predicted dehydrogenase